MKTRQPKKMKICEECGKVFFTKEKNKKYCCKACKEKALKRKRNERGQICWRCKKATGGCSWSSFLQPVEGWNAIPTMVKNREGKSIYNSFKILYCPLFEED